MATKNDVFGKHEYPPIAAGDLRLDRIETRGNQVEYQMTYFPRVEFADYQERLDNGDCDD